MRVLKFKVSGQTLEPVEIPDDLNPGSEGYLQCKFDTNDNSWAGCKLIAEFNRNEAAYVIGGVCLVPDSISSRPIFKVRLHGVRGSKYRIVTNDVIIRL